MNPTLARLAPGDMLVLSSTLLYDRGVVPGVPKQCTYFVVAVCTGKLQPVLTCDFRQEEPGFWAILHGKLFFIAISILDKAIHENLIVITEHISSRGDD